MGRGFRLLLFILILINAAISVSGASSEFLFSDNRFRNKMTTENLDAILDSILEEHPQETLEMLALLCFVEPEHVDDYAVTDYIESFNEIIGNKVVLDFFMSLANWGNQLT